MPTAAEETVDGPPDPASLSLNQGKRRQRIIDSTNRLLAERPYELIQMRDVAAESSVALGTVYRYFISKEHLFGEVLVSWSDIRLSRSDNGAEASPDAHGQITAVIQQMFRAFERYPNYIAVVLVLEATTDVNARASYSRFTDKFRATLADALVAVEPDDIKAVVDLVSAALAFVLRRWMLGFITMDEAFEIQQRSVDLIFGQPRMLN